MGPLPKDVLHSCIETPDHIGCHDKIKAGVTSLSQLVVFAALYPVTDIVLKLQVEEFSVILVPIACKAFPGPYLMGAKAELWFS